ncbi:Large neutral amino acids transporter small subunit 1 [Schistosoma japonicum]|nr:Large neutral amino acids transporter small subunit 1 [Schistosoma japonicum]
MNKIKMSKSLSNLQDSVMHKNENANNDVVIKMEKTIGLVSSVTIIIGSIIGSGIFVSPTGILENMHSFGASLIIWIGCGIFSLLGAYCYAELGTMIQRSGGDYAYVLEAFGSFMGFLRLWIEVMVARPATMAVIAMTFAKYILQPIFPDCSQPDAVVRCLAAVCISHTEEFQAPFEGSNWNPGSIAKAFYSGLFSYAGWNYLNCMIEEMKNPKRDLPIAIVFSCIVVTVVYTLANVAYVTVVSLNEILTTPAVAVTFANRIYGPAWWIMPIFVAFSTFGGVNGNMLTTSRIFFVASRESHMPKFISFLHKDKLTPIPAVIFTCATGIAYLLVTDIYSLMTYLGFVQWLAIGVCVMIVIVFRYTRPDVKRPVKAPLPFAIIYVTVTFLLVIFTFVGAPMESFMGVLIILTGIPVYLVGCVWKKKPRIFQRVLCE